MERFKIGDVVTLMSGGPLMTIESIDNDYCVCVFFIKCNIEVILLINMNMDLI